MTLRLFTFVCEFRRGTYVSQVLALDQRDAATLWTEKLRLERPFGRASVYLAKSVESGLLDFPPVALSGVSGVWCITGSCAGDFMLAEIIETVQPKSFDASNA